MQLNAGEGPCLDATRTGGPDGAPPRLGALTFHLRRPAALAGADLDLATVLAAHLATALVALHRVEESRKRWSTFARRCSAGT